MKKLLYFLTGAAVLLSSASCTREVIDIPEQGAVTFEISLEDVVATRSETIGDGSHCDKLVFEVYDATGNAVGDVIETLSSDILSQSDPNIVKITNGKAEVKLNLAKGQSYAIAFWAQSSECNAYGTSDLKNVTVDYNTVANVENRDAFFAFVEPFKVAGAFNHQVTLRRPFAQLNLAVADLDAVKAAAIDLVNVTVTTTAATKLDLTTGKVSDEQAVEFGTAAVLSNAKIKLADNSEYPWIAMNYLLPYDNTTGEDRITETVSFDNGTNKAPITLTSNATPLQRNWRTNIIAKLTEVNSFNIVIDPDFVNDMIYPEEPVVPDVETGTYEIENERQLLWLAEQLNGGETFAGQTIKLMNDIDMSNVEWTPINLWKNETETIAVIDGNNCTIKGLNVKGAGQLGFIGSFASTAPLTIKNLTFENPDIMGTSSFIGTVIGYQYGEVTMENVKVIGGRVGAISDSKPIRIGGLVGMANEPMTLTGCAVEDVDLYGYHNLSGLVGSVTVDNLVVMNDCLSKNNTFYYVAENDEAWQDFDASGYAEGKSKKNNCTATGNKGINAIADGVVKTPEGYELYNEAGILWFAQQVNENGKTFKGMTIVLQDNVDLDKLPATKAGEGNWTPIGGNVANHPSKTFAGTFDGNGKTILNMNAVDNTANHASAGFFGTITGEVKNLTVKDATVTSTHYAGAIVGYITDGVSVTNCHVDNATITSNVELLANGSYDNGDKVGGIVGYANSVKIAGCTVKNTTIRGYRDLGGIVGYAAGEISGCKVLENVKIIVETAHNYNNYTSAAQHDAGSIVGEGSYTNCEGTATIEFSIETVTWNTSPEIDADGNVKAMTHAEAIANAPEGYRVPTEAEADLMINYGVKTQTETGWTIEFNGQTITLPYNLNDGNDHVFYWVAETIDCGPEIGDYGCAIVSDLSVTGLEVACMPWFEEAQGVIYVKE